MITKYENHLSYVGKLQFNLKAVVQRQYAVTSCGRDLKISLKCSNILTICTYNTIQYMFVLCLSNPTNILST